MSNENTSTLQSYLDKGSALAQSALGSITGSQADKAQAQDKADLADARDKASHVGGNIGGYSVSASGVAENHPDRKAGSWNQTVGSGKEFFGGALGLDGLKQEGERQNAEGKTQEAAGQLSDLGTGITNRLSGAVGGAVAGLTGDREEQERRAAQHDQGKTLQRGAEADIQKQNPDA